MKSLSISRLLKMPVFILIALTLGSLIFLFNKPTVSIHVDNPYYNSSGATTSSDINFYVATDGNDDWSGTLSTANDSKTDGPFKTLDCAKVSVEKIIAKTGLNTGVNTNVNVNIRGGTYFCTKSFTLGSIDSGNSSLQITYKSYNGEKVILNGGYNLNYSDFSTLQDQEMLSRLLNKESTKEVLVADISKYITTYTDKSSIDLAPQLYINDKVMTLSRYPNNGYLNIEAMLNATGDPNYSFTFTGEEPYKWNNNNNNNIYMNGYWNWDWDNTTIKVSDINELNTSISTLDKTNYGMRTGQRFFFKNVLEELDNEGEYYIDYEKKLLYLIPPSDLQATDKIQLSEATSNLVDMSNLKYVTFDGLIFENSRGLALNMTNCYNCIIKNCTVRNLLSSGINISNCWNSGAENNVMYNLGACGIIISGGDRATLKPSNNYVNNNEIYNYALINKTYNPAIKVSGVGMLIAHNYIHDAPHNAILIDGWIRNGSNDITLEYNEISNVLTETDEAGAIYMGRNWTCRGITIRYNYIHDIYNSQPTQRCNGIYLDDCFSSASMYSNIFYKVDTPFLIGGGRDNTVKNNLIIECKNSILYDDRGITWADLTTLYSSLKEVPYTNALWTSRYPNLATILANNSPGTPSNADVEDNVIYNSGAPSIAKAVVDNGVVKNNVSFTTDIKMKDFILANDSQVFTQIPDFTNIPFVSIGRK